jgi:branched-chain amino acid transport system substrate-binding protein
MRGEKMKKFCVLLLVVLLVGASAIVACAPAAQEVTSKTIKFGVCQPLTGPAAGYGMPVLYGVEIIADTINSEGGVKIGGVNYLIEVIAEDDGFTSDGAKAAAEKLVFRDKVKFIFGGCDSHDTIGLQMVTVPNKVLTFNSAWSSDVLRNPETKQAVPYTFKLMQTPHESIRGVWEAIRKAHPEVKKVALFTCNTLSGHWGQELSDRLLRYLGYDVVYNGYFEYGMPDFTPELSKVLATNPDIIHGNATGVMDWGTVIKQSREMGYKGLFMMELGLGGDVLFSVATPKDAEGFIAIDYDWHGPNATPELKAIMDKFVAKAGYSFPALCCWPIFSGCLMQAMQKAGSIDDTDKIAEILETTTFSSQGVTVRFAGKEYYGANSALVIPMTVVEVKGGVFVPIGTISVEQQVSPWPPGLED